MVVDHTEVQQRLVQSFTAFSDHEVDLPAWVFHQALRHYGWLLSFFEAIPIGSPSEQLLDDLQRKANEVSLLVRSCIDGMHSDIHPTGFRLLFELDWRTSEILSEFRPFAQRTVS